MILHEIRGQRIPRVAVLRISVNENNHRPLSSPTHEDIRCFRAVNGLCLKTGWQRRLRVTEHRADNKKSDGEKTSNHDSSASNSSDVRAPSSSMDTHKFIANGFDVRERISAITSLTAPGVRLCAPNDPSPPKLETAAVNFCDDNPPSGP